MRRTARHPRAASSDRIGEEASEVTRSPYHAGELAVQERAGTLGSAAKIGRGIHDAIPQIARDFLAAQPMLFLGATGRDGLVWATVLTGEPGFARAVDDRTIEIDARLEDDDALADALVDGAPVGLLAIDLAARRRMRLNGRIGRNAAGRIGVALDQVYANCPKYIHPRDVRLEARPAGVPAAPTLRGASLAEEQRAAIARADTFFLATSHPEGGADASHRGGPPGFVQVVDARTLRWPDYAGNTMFNSLGNIAAQPRAGLLFLDFATGRTLQLSGRASIRWEPGDLAPFPDAERVVQLDVDRVVEFERARGVASAV
jgi:uncharacterized protein